jgi:hypothetical protein
LRAKNLWLGRRFTSVSIIASAGILSILAAAYYLTYEPAPEIGIEWRSGVTAARRDELERRFRLVNPHPQDHKVRYDLLDVRISNIEALVREPDVADTDDINRPDFTLPLTYRYGNSWMWVANRIPFLREPGVVEALVASCIVICAGGALVRYGVDRRVAASKRSTHGHSGP